MFIETNEDRHCVERLYPLAITLMMAAYVRLSETMGYVGVWEFTVGRCGRRWPDGSISHYYK